MFDPLRICTILNEEEVEYVVVGGFAAVVRGSSLPTRSIDIVPSRSPDNLDRLGRALRRMGAQIRTDGDPVPAPLDGPFLANMPVMLNLVTDFGEMDLTFAPAGGVVLLHNEQTEVWAAAGYVARRLRHRTASPGRREGVVTDLKRV